MQRRSQDGNQEIEDIYKEDIYKSALSLVDHLTGKAIEDCVAEENTLDVQSEQYVSLHRHHQDAATDILLAYLHDKKNKSYLESVRDKLLEKLKNEAIKLDPQANKSIIYKIQKESRFNIYKDLLFENVKSAARKKEIQSLDLKNKVKYFVFRLIVLDIEREILLAEKIFFWRGIVRDERDKDTPDAIQQRNLFSAADMKKELYKQNYTYHERDENSFSLAQSLESIFVRLETIDLSKLISEVDDVFESYIKDLKKDNLQGSLRLSQRITLSSETLVKQNIVHDWLKELEGKSNEIGLKDKSINKLKHVDKLIQQYDSAVASTIEEGDEEVVSLISSAYELLAQPEYMKETENIEESSPSSDSRTKFDWKTVVFIGAGILLGLAAIALPFLIGAGYLFVHAVPHVLPHVAPVVAKLLGVISSVICGGGLGYGAKKVVDHACYSANVEEDLPQDEDKSLKIVSTRSTEAYELQDVSKWEKKQSRRASLGEQGMFRRENPAPLTNESGIRHRAGFHSFS